VQLNTPWALALLALVPVMLLLMRRRGTGANLRFSSLRNIKQAGVSWRIRFRPLLGLARILCIILLIFALARPRQGIKHSIESTKGVVMELVVDHSSSMQTEMGYEGKRLNRLEMVKRVLSDFIKGGNGLEGRPHDLMGLISFARYADTIAPLVHSQDALLGFLKQIELVTQREEDGTAIGDGIAHAAARLHTAAVDIARRNAALKSSGSSADEQEVSPDFEIQSKVIVLLTDGQNNQGKYMPLEAVELAKEWGIKIYTIGIGSRESFMRIQTPFGEQLIPTGQDLDEGLLQEIAKRTGGFYSRADDAEDLRTICEQIDAQEKTEIQSVEYSQYEEKFSLPALAAMAALLAEIALSCTVFRKIP
jgi:Ca-activated chloride channel family protein